MESKLREEQMVDLNIKELLSRCNKENLLVSIYTNRIEPDKFSVGFIEAISNEQILLKHVTEHGLYDGYAVRKLSDVFRVDVNGLYEKRLLKLYQIQNQKHPEKFLKNKISKDSNLFYETLIAAYQDKMVVNICIDETEMQESIIGWVNSIKDMEITVSKISYEGFDDGDSIFDLNDIIKINCDSDDERVIGLLNLNQK